MAAENPLMLYNALFAYAKTLPGDAGAWETLSKMAPTMGAKVLYGKYAEYLKTRVSKRIYRHSAAHSEDVAAVTFVVLAPSIMGRVDKIAHVTRAAGIKVQLLLCFQPPENFTVNHALYGEVLVLTDMYLHINDALKKIREFGSSLIHLFVDCVTNMKAALWAVRSPLPIVGDPYDLCCAQYFSWFHDEKGLHDNVYYENVWLQHVNGLCMRALYMKTKELQSAYRPGLPVFYMPEPVRTEYSMEKKKDAHTDHLHILMDGQEMGADFFAKACEEFFLQAKNAGNITFHIYRYCGRAMPEYDGIIRKYTKLPEAVFLKLLRKCDAFMLPWCKNYFKENGNNEALGKCAARSTASDIIEADIINIVPDYFERIAKNGIYCNRGIAFSQTDQSNPEFWKMLPRRISELYKLPQKRQRFMDVTLASHLKSFYSRVVLKSHNS